MFEGSIVALVTPMTEMGEIDFDSLTKLIEFHLNAGTDGIVAVGTTGESGTLSHKEHIQVIRHIVETVKDRIPVIAGTGKVATHETIDFTREVMELGVQACLLLAPPYVKPTQEGLYRHYRAIAEAVPIPQIIYNVPGRTACDILPQTITRLANIPNIVGVKEASGDAKRTREIVERCGERIDVYSGEDSATLAILQAGGKGVISVTANVVPKLMHDMCEAALQDDITLARQINDRLSLLHNALFLESNPIPTKWCLHDMGMIPPGIRLPLTPLSPDHFVAVRQARMYAEKIQ